MSDFPVVARTANFEGGGGIHTAEGGGGVYHVRYELYRNLFRMVFRKISYDMAVRTLVRRWICWWTRWHACIIEMLREENLVLRTPATSQVIQAPGGGGALTTTKVPQFDGTTSWEQYHQVFEAIVRLGQ